MAFAQWAAGMKLTASRLAGITPKFQSYTPTWSTVTGNALPSYGNAVIACRWAQSGDLVVVNFRITFGNTTNFGVGATGSDNWVFGLPVSASSNNHVLGFLSVAASTARGVVILPILDTADRFVIAGTSGKVDGGAGPGGGFIDGFTNYFTSGDSLEGILNYEAA